MTCSTSEVAVCCSSDSVSSSVRWPGQWCAGAIVQQSRVLDSNHCLGGKIPNQLDLLVSEGTDFLAGHGEHTDQLALL